MNNENPRNSEPKSSPDTIEIHDLDPVAVFERRKRIVQAIVSEVALMNKELEAIEVVHEQKTREAAEIDDILTEMRDHIDMLETAEQNILDTLTHDQRCEIINNGAE